MATSKFRLTESQHQHLLDEGYLMLPDLIDIETIDALRDEFHKVVDATAVQMHKEGIIPEPFSAAGFDRQLAKIAAFRVEAARELVGRIQGEDGSSEGGHMGPGIFNLLRHPRLLDAVESIVGPEIIGSSVYRIRAKAPGLERGAVPWHQDSGYLMGHCDHELIITCWVPMVDANVENGCLYVLPKAHREGILPHHVGGRGGYLVITEDDLPEGSKPIAVPVPKGGALLMTNMTPHASFANESDHVRWSVDLRFQSAGVPTNIGREPEEIDLEGPEIEIACYPPEADFVLRSQRDPSQEVSDWRELKAMRDQYSAKAQRLMIAERWKPLSTSS